MSTPPRGTKRSCDANTNESTKTYSKRHCRRLRQQNCAGQPAVAQSSTVNVSPTGRKRLFHAETNEPCTSRYRKRHCQGLRESESDLYPSLTRSGAGLKYSDFCNSLKQKQHHFVRDRGLSSTSQLNAITSSPNKANRSNISIFSLPSDSTNGNISIQDSDLSSSPQLNAVADEVCGNFHHSIANSPGPSQQSMHADGQDCSQMVAQERSVNSSSSSVVSLDLGSSLATNLSSLLSVTLNPSHVQSAGNAQRDMSVEEFRIRLQVYCVENNLTHAAVNNLLQLLRMLPQFIKLPKTARTLLKTIREVKAKELAPGETYVHLGFKDLLTLYYVIVRPVERFEIFVGIDGLPIAKSSHSHFWPILCAIVPENAYEECFVAAVGIWHGTQTKPSNNNIFLKPFVEDVSEIINKGVSIDGKTIPVNLLGLTFDAVAKSDLLFCKGHGGYYACPRCKIPGVQAGGVHFPGVDYPPRTHREFLPDYLDYLIDNLIEDDHRQAYSILEKIPRIDLVLDTTLDYMHLFTAVVKTMIGLMLRGRNPAKLSADQVSKINKRLAKIRECLCREFARKLKSINLYGCFKATQCRQFILYTAIVFLYKILPEDQYNNLVMLHVASYIILHPVLSVTHLNKARDYFKQFILEYTRIYGENHTTYYIHMLQHLPDDVRRFKNINRSSAYHFENYLGPLGRLLRNGNLPLSQAVKRLAEKACAKYAKESLKEYTDNHKSPSEIQYSVEHTSAGPLPNGFSSPQYLVAVFPQKYTLRASDTIKDNCFVTQDNDIIVIHNIVTSNVSGEKFVLYKKFLNKTDFYRVPIKSSELGIYRVDSLSRNTEYLPITELKNKCALVKLRRTTFVAFPMLHSAF